MIHDFFAFGTGPLNEFILSMLAGATTIIAIIGFIITLILAYRYFVRFRNKPEKQAKIKKRLRIAIAILLASASFTYWVDFIYTA